MSNSGFNVTWDGKDLTELKKSVKALGDVPQKCVTSAAGKAATLTNHPDEEGALQGEWEVGVPHRLQGRR